MHKEGVQAGSGGSTPKGKFEGINILDGGIIRRTTSVDPHRAKGLDGKKVDTIINIYVQPALHGAPQASWRHGALPEHRRRRGPLLNACGYEPAPMRERNRGRSKTNR